MLTPSTRHRAFTATVKPQMPHQWRHRTFALHIHIHAHIYWHFMSLSMQQHRATSIAEAAFVCYLAACGMFQCIHFNVCLTTWTLHAPIKILNGVIGKDISIIYASQLLQWNIKRSKWVNLEFGWQRIFLPTHILSCMYLSKPSRVWKNEKCEPVTDA